MGSLLERFLGILSPTERASLSGSAVSTISPEQLDAALDRAAIFDAVRALYGAFDENEVRAIDRGIDKAIGLVVPAPQVGISAEAFEMAARELEPGNLPHALAAIRAVDEVESGNGWFQGVRADILALDGPGGFLDGPNLPKILFEAHKFSAHTGGRFNASHPTLSSRSWNRKLYVGGEGEYARLYAAMQLDHDAALMSASWGRYQILGSNYALAGFPTVRAFVDAMKESEERHLDAFVAFLKSARLVDAFRRISTSAKDCEAFARGYNGTGFATHNYHGKIAAAFGRWSKKLRA